MTTILGTEGICVLEASVFTRDEQSEQAMWTEVFGVSFDVLFTQTCSQTSNISLSTTCSDINLKPNETFQ
jgi:hypothetical protein